MDTKTMQKTSWFKTKRAWYDVGIFRANCWYKGDSI